MKKITAILLIVVMVISLGACRKEKEPAEEGTSDTGNTVESFSGEVTSAENNSGEKTLPEVTSEPESNQNIPETGSEKAKIFQLVKVALSSIVAFFGTYQIAANDVAQSIWSLAALAGVAMGPAFITVIGQCMGNKDTEAADYYLTKLSKITLLLSSAWNLVIFLFTPLFLRFYALEPQTKELVIWLVLIHNLFNAVAFQVI